MRYQRPTLTEDTSVEYNVDVEDEVWLANNEHFGTAINAKKINFSSSNEVAMISEDSATGGESSDDDALGLKKKPTLPLQMFEHIIDLLEKATALETIITLSQAERMVLAKIPEILLIFGATAQNGPTQKEQKQEKKDVTVSIVINEVYNYWVNKRSKLRKPLLRKYWPVTASNDTNPHMVFRPREKEKYKLRKKRQNDLESYKKMKQLRIDFTKIRALLQLIQHRESLSKCMLDMQCDWFEQRLYEMIDTSALPRESDRLSHNEIDEVLDIPKLFDTQNVDRSKKKKRKRASNAKGGAMSPMPVEGNITPINVVTQPAPKSNTQNLPVRKHFAANQANPPTFLNPLRSREKFVTSWEHAVPFISSYANAKPVPTSRFRHRPRIGRGGRVIIDRIPQPGNPNDPPIDVYTTGEGARTEGGDNRRAARMLDLLPEPLDTDIVRCRLEEIAAAALIDDEENAMKLRVPTLPSGPNSASQPHDVIKTEEILVKLSDWMETDEQIFGTELGPPLGPV